MLRHKHTTRSILLSLGLIFLLQNSYSQKTIKSDSIYVIVGSFKNQYNAIYLSRDLRKKGFKNAITRAPCGKKGKTKTPLQGPPVAKKGVKNLF